jgi:hypothetical protein
LTLADGAHVELFELKPDSRYYFDVALFGCGKRWVLLSAAGRLVMHRGFGVMLASFRCRAP